MLRQPTASHTWTPPKRERSPSALLRRLRPRTKIDELSDLRCVRTFAADGPRRPATGCVANMPYGSTLVYRSPLLSPASGRAHRTSDRRAPRASARRGGSTRTSDSRGSRPASSAAITAGQFVVPSSSGRKVCRLNSCTRLSYSLKWMFLIRLPRIGIQCSGNWYCMMLPVSKCTCTRSLLKAVDEVDHLLRAEEKTVGEDVLHVQIDAGLLRLAGSACCIGLARSGDRRHRWAPARLSLSQGM